MNFLGKVGAAVAMVVTMVVGRTAVVCGALVWTLASTVGGCLVWMLGAEVDSAFPGGIVAWKGVGPCLVGRVSEIPLLLLAWVTDGMNAT